MNSVTQEVMSEIIRSVGFDTGENPDIMEYCSVLYKCVYTVVKDILFVKYAKKVLGKYNSKFLNHILAILLIILGIIVVLPWLLLKKCLVVHLRIKHGPDFVEFLHGMDMVEYMVNPKLQIIMVYIMEHTGDPNDLLEDIKKSCQNLHESHFKFSSVIRTCLGYTYYLKNQVNFEDIISIEECHQEYLTKENLTRYLDDKYLTGDSIDEKLWDVKVLNKPIKWGSNTSTYFPVVIRTNHALTDAICLSSFHQKFLVDKIDNQKFIKTMSISNNVKKANNLKLHEFAIGSKYDSGLCLEKDSSRISALFIEDEPVCMARIKKIKDNVKCTFTDVITSAMVKSLSSHCVKKNISLDRISFGMTCRSSTEKSKGILECKTFANEASTINSILPFKNNSISNMLHDISKVLKSSRNSLDAEAIYLMYKIGSSFPLPVIKYLSKIVMAEITVLLTNIPSFQSGHINNHLIEDLFIYVNSFDKIRFMFQVSTYGDRLHINLVSWDNMVGNREELMNILNNTITNIDQLYEELV